MTFEMKLIYFLQASIGSTEKEEKGERSITKLHPHSNG
jgi:hypothetical protein